MLENRLELEKRFGIIVRGMAYPDTGINKLASGVSYDRIRTYLSELDIVYSRTLGGDNKSFNIPTDWYAWMPTAHHNNTNLLVWIDEFVNLDRSTSVYGARREPKLLYIWGHSYEFERDGNWNRLDEICTKISDKNDCWYATNMEIYNYVKAYQSLIYSADGKIVYNPSLIHIWFDVDGTLYDIKPGETIKI